MKLLILTQSVDLDDSSLSFFHDWIESLAKRSEFITVICLKEGRHSLPKNVNILSLGKEKGESKFKYILNFYKFIFSERKNYDSVFVHMNPEYVALGGVLWRLWGKKIIFWYTHRQISPILKVAEKLSNQILTAAPESFRLRSHKVHVVGHGINLKRFEPVFDQGKKIGEKLKILTIGRITSIKNLDVFLETVFLLKGNGFSIEATVIGEPILKHDFDYFEYLKSKVKELSLDKEINFVGKVEQEQIPHWYKSNDILVNLTPEGGLDKVVLEAMASGLVPISSNKAFRKIFGEFSIHLIFEERDPKDLSNKIRNLTTLDLPRIRNYLKKEVKEKASLDNIVNNIINYL